MFLWCYAKYSHILSGVTKTLKRINWLKLLGGPGIKPLSPDSPTRAPCEVAEVWLTCWEVWWKEYRLWSHGFKSLLYPFTRCMNLDKLLDVSKPHLPPWPNIRPSKVCCEHYMRKCLAQSTCEKPVSFSSCLWLVITSEPLWQKMIFLIRSTQKTFCSQAKEQRWITVLVHLKLI